MLPLCPRVPGDLAGPAAPVRAGSAAAERQVPTVPVRPTARVCRALFACRPRSLRGARYRLRYRFGTVFETVFEAVFENVFGIVHEGSDGVGDAAQQDDRGWGERDLCPVESDQQTV